MEFGFTAEQERLRGEVREFCKGQPYGELDAKVSPDFSPTFFRSVAEKGWLGLGFPPEYGGMGKGKTEETIFTEEMASHRAPIAFAIYGRTVPLCGTILLKHGSEEQKRFYLSAIARGEIGVGQGFSESGAGSDLKSLKTVAVRKGEKYVLNGEKAFQSWADRLPYMRKHGVGCHVLLLARTDLTRPPEKSMGLFLFDSSTLLPGMTVYPKLTMDGRTACQVFFDNVEIPATSLVGRENEAWDYVVESGVFYWNGRLGYYVGLMNGLLRDLVQFVKDTEIGGQRLGSNVLVRQKVAEMATRIEGLRLYTYRFAWAYDKGLDIIGPGSLMKLHTDRLLLYFANSAMQILGLSGQLKKGSKYAPLKGTIENMYRFLVVRSFGSTGPSAMRSVVAGYVLGLPNEFGLIY